MTYKTAKRSEYVDAMLKSERNPRKELKDSAEKKLHQERLNKQAGDYLMKLMRKKKISKIDINQAVNYLMDLVRLNRGT